MTIPEVCRKRYVHADPMRTPCGPSVRDWSVAGIGDFNGDGKADILWRSTNGALADWTMNGSVITAAELLTSQGNAVSLDSSFTFGDIGDFDGDGKSDILWRSTNGALDDGRIGDYRCPVADLPRQCGQS